MKACLRSVNVYLVELKVANTQIKGWCSIIIVLIFICYMYNFYKSKHVLLNMRY